MLQYLKGQSIIIHVFQQGVCHQIEQCDAGTGNNNLRTLRNLSQGADGDVAG